jgi:hypothetical protein
LTTALKAHNLPDMTTRFRGAGPLIAPAVAGWVAVVGATIAILAALHALGSATSFAVDWSNPWTWTSRHSPERVLLAAGRLVALGLGYWVLVSTLLCTVARWSRIPAFIRSVEWATLPVVRRTAERFVAMSLTVSALAPLGTLAATASEPPPTPGTGTAPTVARVEPPPPDDGSAPARAVLIPASDTPIIVPVPTAALVDPADDGAPAAGENGTFPPHEPATIDDAHRPGAPPRVLPDVRGTQPHVHAVVEGESLWTIAELHVQTALGRTPTDGETATYWSRLIDANRTRLSSGDPDLIYPGELMVCPPTAEVGLDG